ncbi:MAG: HAD-IA family hydrolase [Clostridiales bacterium]|nr:HAD-IA family hydrolase [Clostridiales bacterium]
MKAVIFDMDGVIFDSETLVLETWREVARRHKIPDIESVCRKCLGLDRIVTKQIFLAHYGEDFPYDAYKAEMSALFHQRAGGGKLPQKPGIRELLTFLREKGIQTAVASSTRRDIVCPELRDGRLLDLFDAVICGDMVEKSKPEPDIFLRACRELKVKPEEAWVIEDSYNGIRAASAAGTRPMMIPDLAEPTPEMGELAACILPSLAEARDVFSILLGDREACGIYEERCEAEVSTAEYLNTCVDVPTFLEYCRACPNYGKIWSCPEFDFDPVDYWRKYETLHLLGVKIYLPERLVKCDFSKEFCGELTACILDTFRRELDHTLLRLEKENPGSVSLSGGSCARCREHAGAKLLDHSGCTKSLGLPCRHPDQMRYSIEALGGNVGLTVTKYLHQELLWMEEGRLPRYYTLVMGLLLPDEAQKIKKSHDHGN